MPITRTHDPSDTTEGHDDSNGLVESLDAPRPEVVTHSLGNGGQPDHLNGNGEQSSPSGERSPAPRNGKRRTPASNGHRARAARGGDGRARRSPADRVPEGPVFIEGQLPLEREAVLKAVADGRAMGQAELAQHIGDALGVAPSTALGKIRGLEREGAIVGFKDGRRKGYLLPEPVFEPERVLEPEPAFRPEREPERVFEPERALERDRAFRPRTLPPGATTPAYDTLVHELPGEPVEHAADGPRGPRIPRLRSLLSRAGGPSRPERSRIARTAPILLVVLGTLLLAEGIITVTWQEPFTSLSAARSQGRLDNDLGTAEERERRLSQARVARLRNDQRKIDAFMAERATAVNEKTPPGEALGRLKIDKIDLNLVMVQATGEDSLAKGPSHYTETVLPGRAGIMGIAGHRTTYSAPFRNINELKAGNEIVVTMPYGRFTYKVVGQEIVDAAFGGVFTAASFPGRQLPKKDAAAGDGKPAAGDAGGVPTAGEDGTTGGGGKAGAGGAGAGDGGDPPEALSSDFGGLALTACHPLYSAAQRIIVYARLDSTQPIGGTRRAATS